MKYEQYPTGCFGGYVERMPINEFKEWVGIKAEITPDDIYIPIELFKQIALRQKQWERFVELKGEIKRAYKRK